MQKKLIVAALAGIAAAPAFAQTNVTVYGRINTSIESESQSGSRAAVLVRSNASRLGFKGTEELGNGLKAVFGIESQVNGDSGKAFDAIARNVFVGLESGAGTLVVGRLDVNAGSGAGAPAYSAFGAVWNDINQDNGTTGLTQSGGVEAFGVANDAADRAVFGIRTRTDNSIGYASPTIAGGLKVYARYAMLGNQNRDAAPSATAGSVYENDTHESEVAAVYKAGPLAVTGAYTSRSKRGGLGTDGFDNRWQIGAGYDLGVVKLGAIYAATKYANVSAGNRDTPKEFGVSAKLPFGKNEVIANYTSRQLQGVEGLSKNGKDRTWQVGYGYNFSARTRGYAFYQNRDFDTDQATRTSGNATAAAAATNYGNEPVKVLGIGLRHNF